MVRKEMIDGSLRTVLKVDLIEVGGIEVDSISAQKVRVVGTRGRSNVNEYSVYSTDTTIDGRGVSLVRKGKTTRRVDDSESQVESFIGLSFYHGAPVIKLKRGRKEIMIAWDEGGLYEYRMGRRRVLLKKAGW